LNAHLPHVAMRHAASGGNARDIADRPQTRRSSWNFLAAELIDIEPSV
jgi:hypothetical protein